MNHSIYSADRTTHLKIVVVALVAGILVAGFSISTRNSSDEGLTQTARVMKAGKPVIDHAVRTAHSYANRGISRNSRGSLPAPQSRHVDI